MSPQHSYWKRDVLLEVRERFAFLNTAVPRDPAPTLSLSLSLAPQTAGGMNQRRVLGGECRD